MGSPIFYTLRFLGLRTELGSIQTLRFEKPPGLEFLSGQWLHLAAAVDPQDRSLVRHMSVASASTDPFLEFTMDLGSSSEYKKALARLQPGDGVSAFKVKGEFTVDPRSTRPLVFMAGGLGITPIRSILRDRAFQRAGLPWSLVHVSRAGWLFQDELSALGGKQWRCTRGSLEENWDSMKDSWGGGVDFYLCGSRRFLDGMVQRLGAGDFPGQRIVTEDFR